MICTPLVLIRFDMYDFHIILYRRKKNQHYYLRYVEKKFQNSSKNLRTFSFCEFNNIATETNNITIQTHQNIDYKL